MTVQELERGFRGMSMGHEQVTVTEFNYNVVYVFLDAP